VQPGFFEPLETELRIRNYSPKTCESCGFIPGGHLHGTHRQEPGGRRGVGGEKAGRPLPIDYFEPWG